MHLEQSIKINISVQLEMLVFLVYTKKKTFMFWRWRIDSTNNSKLYNKIKLIRNHGLVNRDSSKCGALIRV